MCKFISLERGKSFQFDRTRQSTIDWNFILGTRLGWFILSLQLAMQWSILIRQLGTELPWRRCIDINLQYEYHVELVVCLYLEMKGYKSPDSERSDVIMPFTLAISTRTKLSTRQNNSKQRLYKITTCAMRRNSDLQRGRDIGRLADIRLSK